MSDPCCSNQILNIKGNCISCGRKSEDMDEEEDRANDYD